MAKPIGPLCNLNCAYCYYLEKTALYPNKKNFRMQPEVLERFVAEYIQAMRHLPEIHFTWQGGEPTLLGLAFFERVVALQEKHRPAGVRIHNSLQTNGVLLDDAWGEFLNGHDFLVGVSIDGPPELHDVYRRDRGGRPTAEAVLRGVRILRRFEVPFNALVCVHRANADSPLEVYRYLKSIGATFMQFIPIVRAVGEKSNDIAPYSVRPEQYGRFLIEIFDAWLARDVGRVFIQIIESTLSSVVYGRPTLCVFSETCGNALAIEHNGDLYACDHFVDAEHRLGNIMELPLHELAHSRRQQEFGLAKRDTLPSTCRDCEVLQLCRGGCPKNRITTSPTGEPGLNDLCTGYKAFFKHVQPVMEAMAQAL